MDCRSSQSSILMEDERPAAAWTRGDVEEGRQRSLTWPASRSTWEQRRRKDERPTTKSNVLVHVGAEETGGRATGIVERHSLREGAATSWLRGWIDRRKRKAAGEATQNCGRKDA